MKESKYSLAEVQEKVNEYLEGEAFKVNERFVEVSILRDSIENAIKKGCKNNNRKYQLTFNQVIEKMEQAILSSKNWFNEDGLNFKSFRDCLNVRVESGDKFLSTFELKHNIKGDKNEKLYDVKELICIGQAKRFKGNFPKLPNWQFNPCLRFKKVEILDNSDAYQEEVIDYNSKALGAIIKGFNNNYVERTILMGIHTHSYSESKNGDVVEYCPTLEKFELILII